MKESWKTRSSSVVTLDKFFLNNFEEITAKILFSRGISSEKEATEYLNPEYESSLYDPFILDGMEDAVVRVMDSLEKKEKVCIFGDYDADGVTSAALLLDFFGQIGINSFVYIPDRNLEGYGLNNGAIDCIETKKAKLVITVDCGISNSDEVEYAKKKGIDVVILDHHHVPQNIPKAVAVVDPKKNFDEYPEKFLAGVGVVFKFVQALSLKLKNYDKEQIKWFLDLVAIGTVADCVPLLGENRILVKYGLVVLGKTKRVGLKQLFHVGRIAINGFSHPTSQQIGFQIGPRINAAGRMDHANTALELLSCKQGEEAKARLLALEIESQNKHRQKVTEEIIKEIESRLGGKRKEQPVIIESSPHWEFGVVGLAAGKIADKYRKPTILLQEKDGIYRGSGRSANEINMIEVIEKMDDILESFGGHAQAFGLKVTRDNFDSFKKSVQKELAQMPKVSTQKKIFIDAEIKFSEIKPKLLTEISSMEPFGQGNEKPVFLSKEVVVGDIKVLGNGEKHLKLRLQENGQENFSLETIGFGVAEEFKFLEKGDVIDVVYCLENNEWNGIRKIQGILLDAERVRKID